MVLEAVKEYKSIRVKTVRGGKKGAVHVQILKQNFTDELLILASLPLALPLVPPQRLAPLGHVFEVTPQRNI